MIRKFTWVPALALTCVLLAGCQEPAQATVPETVVPTEATVPAQTVAYTTPADTGAGDVTALGSYTDRAEAEAVVAAVGEEQLTNGVLRAFYWMEVARYRDSGEEIQPDLSLPLDVQTCPVDTSVNSWQQYFLEKALDTWHTAQALAVQGHLEGLPLEDAYQPNQRNHERNMQDKPATQFLYGYNQDFRPNTMHQAYLDEIPRLLSALAEELGYADAETMAREAMGTDLEALTEAVSLYNFGYMYMTNLSHYLEYTEEELQAFTSENPQYADETPLVSLRHILVVPQGEDVVIGEDGTVTCSRESWDAAKAETEALRRAWREGGNTEKVLAELAYLNSDDPGSSLTGGLYRNVRRGQLTKALDDWCFYTARQVGDTAIIRSDYGFHLVYLSGRTTAGELEVQEALLAQKQNGLITAAREAYPMTVDYGAIGLTGGTPSIAPEDVLYPDVAHERYPEIPVYLQQDYPYTMYGAYPVATHGCGITSMAMLATYMMDDELTVPELCARYGRYCVESGTNNLMFNIEPANLGFYLVGYTRDHQTAKEALQKGYPVVSLQHKGYWTRGGHFIVIEEITEDDLVRVRDSNIFNYGSLEAHKEDLHGWDTITPRSVGYWIYQQKVTRIPGCSRCGGESEVLEGMMGSDFVCHKCDAALLRRNSYLNYIPEA